MKMKGVEYMEYLVHYNLLCHVLQHTSAVSLLLFKCFVFKHVFRVVTSENVNTNKLAIFKLQEIIDILL